jgi:hypothetical protein
MLQVFGYAPDRWPMFGNNLGRLPLMSQIRGLQMGAKFDEICDLLAMELGYGEQLLNEYNDLSDTALNIRDELLTGGFKRCRRISDHNLRPSTPMEQFSKS